MGVKIKIKQYNPAIIYGQNDITADAIEERISSLLREGYEWRFRADFPEGPVLIKAVNCES